MAAPQQVAPARHRPRVALTHSVPEPANHSVTLKEEVFCTAESLPFPFHQTKAIGGRGGGGESPSSMQYPQIEELGLELFGDLAPALQC